MNRFNSLPNDDDEFLICMICITSINERYKNFQRQKQKVAKLALYNGITPKDNDFNKKYSRNNFHSRLNSQQGVVGLWLSNIDIFEYFLKSKHTYLVVVEDDAVLPENIEHILRNKYVNHKQFLKLGGTRLGQYASCNLYNKMCIKNILETIRMKCYPIDRGIDHYISNIPYGTKQNRPYLVYCKLSDLPSKIVNVDQNISQKSTIAYYNVNNSHKVNKKYNSLKSKLIKIENFNGIKRIK